MFFLQFAALADIGRHCTPSSSHDRQQKLGELEVRGTEAT